MSNRTKSYRHSDLRCSAIRSVRYGEPNAISNAVDYAKFFSRSHDAVIRVYDDASNVMETHEQAEQFKSDEFVLASRHIFTKTNP